MYGQLGLDLLARGMTPQQALDFMLRGDEGRENRQVAILDLQGRNAAWTGKKPAGLERPPLHAGLLRPGKHFGRGLKSLDGMVAAFEAAKGQRLAERLLAALDGGQAAGGDRRGMQAAALVIVKPLAGAAGFSDRAVDVRVDDHRAPIPELRRIFNVLRSNQILAEALNQFRGNQPAEALRTALVARDLSPANDNVWVALAQFYMALDRKKRMLRRLAQGRRDKPGEQIAIAAQPGIRTDPARSGVRKNFRLRTLRTISESGGFVWSTALRRLRRGRLLLSCSRFKAARGEAAVKGGVLRTKKPKETSHVLFEVLRVCAAVSGRRGRSFTTRLVRVS